MQPCQVCGGMAIDVNGYCTQCGTFRGQVAQSVSGAPMGGYPPQQPGPYQQYPPQQQPGYPAQGYPAQASGVPYPAATSGPPAYPNQVSAPPTSGVPGFPGYPPQPQRSRSFTAPLIAGSAVLVVLVAAIVIVAIARSGGKSDPVTQPSTGTVGTSPTAAIDSCLVGTWRVTREAQQIDIPGVGPVTVTGQGSHVVVKANGSTSQDYDSSTPYEGTANGHKLTITATGGVTGTITTSNGTMAFHGQVANGTLTVEVDGAQVGSTEPLSVNNDPVQYSCAGSTLTEHTSQYDVTLTKISGSTG